MALPDRRDGERRGAPDRRSGAERRSGATTPETARLLLVHGERRAAPDRRRHRDRRSGPERRLSHATPQDQLAHAVDLIAHVAESTELSDEDRRALDSAIVRLRFALARMGPPRD
jgi:hypothetical protein